MSQKIKNLLNVKNVTTEDITNLSETFRNLRTNNRRLEATQRQLKHEDYLQSLLENCDDSREYEDYTRSILENIDS